MKDEKLNRKLTNLKYRMQKAGYEIDSITMTVIRPPEAGMESHRREREMQKLGYSIQYNMFPINSNNYDENKDNRKKSSNGRKKA
ncbi:hypothetical protein [uncultured Bacteroides sp.]|uniref:hypothetical protein n=1 Tax=uncultured Bacteroides sp. TaxID=162156 RepID=UPI002AABDFA7|nr:hypothetical protein [uncultured Bacteroides sp.]